MTRTFHVATLVFAAAVSISTTSGAMAHGGGHNMSRQHANGPTMTSGRSGSAAAAKSVNLGGLSKFVIKNAIKSGRVVAGALGSVGGAMAAPGKCSGNVCSGSPP